MKMEVVLSAPGCFGNDGTPFKSEEIREWSRVDRLTGMLERARIETGRWRTTDDASAHSYGKVTDLRERNSANGCITQKAKRQVEIFQSQEPGRSVQIFRASQWSSSRITDGIIKSVMSNRSQDPGLSGINEVLEADSWNLPALTTPSADVISFDSNDNDTFQINKNSSLEISNRAEKYKLPKRSNSDEDLSSLMDSNGSSRIATMSFARDCKNRRSLQIPSNITMSSSDQDDLKKNQINKEIYSTAISNSTGNSAFSVKIDQQKLSDGSSLRPKSTRVTSLSRQPRSSSSTPRPNAITVVNLMHPESFQDNCRNKISSIITFRTFPEHSEDTLKSSKLPITETISSGDGSGLNIPNRAIKKVGFSKTEIHFAADSGKVNIVETDEKPPPTNKFRRRRRNSNQIGTLGNSIGKFVENDISNSNGKAIQRRMIPKEEGSDNGTKISGIENDNSGAYCVVDIESKKFWANPDVNSKIQMTTANFNRPDKRVRDVEELKKIDDLASPKVISQILTRKTKGPDCNIITTDSENNRVLSTVITTHESTIARVEDNPINSRSTDKCYSKLPVSKKKKESKVILSVDTVDSRSSKTRKTSNNNGLSESPVYVNVFKSMNSQYPIYENYRADSINDKSIPMGSKFSNALELYTSKSNLEKKRSKAKSPNKFGKRSPISLSRLSSLSKSSGKSNDVMKTKAAKKNVKKVETIKSSGKSSKPINMESKPTKLETGTESLRSKRVPMEVVYRTAVFNMKNEKLSKPIKAKDTKATPRYINDLICGSKTGRTNSTKRKGSTPSQTSTRGASQMKHWK